MEEIILPRRLVNRILHQAQSSSELEICGLIASTDGQPTDCIVIDNVSNKPDRLFCMDPQAQINAMRKFREQGKELFAIYHSHPHSPAIPSATDLAEAGYPQALYLIISLNTKGVLEIRGYRLRDEHAIEVLLEI